MLLFRACFGERVAFVLLVEPLLPVDADGDHLSFSHWVCDQRPGPGEGVSLGEAWRSLRLMELLLRLVEFPVF